MAMQFELTIKLSGNSLQEIDEALMSAAGERLTSRMAKPQADAPPTAPRASKPPGLSFKADSDKRGRGRPPLKEGEVGKYVPRQSAQAVEPAPVKAPKIGIDEARAAISKVNETLGFDHAENALRFFGVQKVAELPDASFGEFIQYCERMLES